MAIGTQWSWPILALLASVGQSVPLVIAGNPTIWVVAAAIWAPVTGWAGPLVLLKPSVAPLALLGITRRSWWIAAGLLALACIPFGSLWIDWLRAVVNIHVSGPEKAAYSLGQLPMLLVPLVAVLAQGTNRTLKSPRPEGGPAAEAVEGAGGARVQPAPGRTV